MEGIGCTWYETVAERISVINRTHIVYMLLTEHTVSTFY